MAKKKFSDDGLEDIVKYYEEKGKITTVEASTWSKPRCHEGHPVLKVANGYLLGASCNSPRTGFDVYVGFDSGMDATPNSYPWSKERVESIYFPIRDYSVPKDVGEFKAMVTWICNQLQAGKKVHMGCIGGHGRTGTVMAAIMAELGEKDAIAWVRKNHCTKAVESDEQVSFLVKHYGVVKAAGAKKYTTTTTKGGGTASQKFLFDKSGTYVGSAGFKSASEYETSGSFTSSGTLSPVTSKKNIWRT